MTGLARQLKGRDDARSLLRAALDGALRGRGGFVVVRGEPGIGKTALVEELARAVEKDDVAAVFRGRAWELGDAPPYFPLGGALRGLGLAPPLDGADVFRFWEDVAAALATRARQRPMVWVLEDLHAADLQSLDLLAFLVQPVRALPVLVVATARAEDPRISARAAERLVRVTRGGVEIMLEPLGVSDVAAVASDLLGRPLSPADARALAELTGGNPLFVVECARSFRASGGGARARLALPPTVRQIVLERVDLLPEATRRLLAAAATLGRESVAGTIAKMEGTLPARVIDLLRPAAQAGVIEETRPGYFAFSHALVLSAVYEAIPEVEKAELHARAERALAHAGDGVDAMVERVRHALASDRDDDHAFSLAAEVAQKLESLGASDRALALHLRVAEARARRGLPPRAPEENLHVASVAFAAGRHAEARSIAASVLETARAARDAALFARAALLLGLEVRPATVDESLVRVLEEAQRMLGDGPSAAKVRVTARLSAALQPAQDPSQPVAMALGAVEAARAFADDALVLEVIHLASPALVDYAPLATRLAVDEEYRDRARAHEDDAKELRAEVLFTLDLLQRGALGEAAAAAARAESIGARALHPRHRWRALLLTSMMAVARGDLATSERALMEARDFAALTDDPSLQRALHAHAGQVARFLHRDDELAVVREAIPSVVAGIMHGQIIGDALRLAIDTRLEAVESVRQGLARMSETSFDDGDLFFLSVGAEAAAFAGDLEVAARWRARLAPFADQHAVGGHVPYTYEGPIARVIALLDATAGKMEQATRSLVAQRAALAAVGFRTFVAQLDYDLGSVLARAGDHSGAVGALASAAALAEALGMPGLAARAAARLAELAPAKAPATPLPTSSPSSSDLRFVREGDVHRVTFRGRSLSIKDSRGMQMLAQLVERPGEDVHVLVLASDDPSASLDEGGATDAIDARARASYKARLVAIDEELAEAERDQDRAREERLHREKDALTRELARAFGLGGRARAAGASERARVNVQRRLKDAIARIAEADPVLGAFLGKAVRTGTYCRFFV